MMAHIFVINAQAYTNFWGLEFLNFSNHSLSQRQSYSSCLHFLALMELKIECTDEQRVTRHTIPR